MNTKIIFHADNKFVADYMEDTDSASMSDIDKDELLIGADYTDIDSIYSISCEDKDKPDFMSDSSYDGNRFCIYVSDSIGDGWRVVRPNNGNDFVFSHIGIRTNLSTDSIIIECIELFLNNNNAIVHFRDRENGNQYHENMEVEY